MPSNASVLSKLLRPGGDIVTESGEAVSQGTSTYATPDVLPLTGNSTGDTAFVESTDRLYIWNGSGWYNIALINTAPSITSGGAGSYELATDGTPTVITLVAEDPEGIPITWSYSVTSGSLGNTAAVSQVDNVFTITPSTNEADVGEFTITFTASDGVNIATDVNSFSLAFAPPTIDLASPVTIVSNSNVTNSGEQGIEVTQDGAYMLQADNLANVHIWSLNTPYDVSQVSNAQTDQYTGLASPFNDDYIGGIRVSADLSQAFMANSAYARMIRFGQTSSDVDNPGHVSQTPNQTQEGNNIYLYLNTNSNFWDIAKDGSAFYGVNSNERLWIHTMNTPYDLSSFSGNPEGNVDLTAVSGVPSNSWNVSAVAANDDGTRIWVGTSQYKIYQFDFSTANDYTTITYTGEYSSASPVAGLAYAGGYLYVEHNGSVEQLSN